jgi:hypothetical protein
MHICAQWSHTTPTAHITLLKMTTTAIPFEWGRVSLTSKVEDPLGCLIFLTHKSSTRLTDTLAEHHVPPISHISGALPPVAPKCNRDGVLRRELPTTGFGTKPYFTVRTDPQVVNCK